MAKAKVGDTIRILELDDPFDKSYPGRIGVVKYIDSAGSLHGTWGGLAVLPDIDKFEIINTVTHHD